MFFTPPQTGQFVVTTELNGNVLTTFTEEADQKHYPVVVGLAGGSGRFSVAVEEERASVVVPDC